MTDAPSLDDALAAALRRALAPWTVDTVADRLGERAMAALDREQIVPGLRAARAAGDDATAVLTRVFMLGDEVPRGWLADSLDGVDVAALEARGWLTAAGAHAADPVRALVDLRPYQVEGPDGALTWWVASDLGESVTGRALDADHVLGIGGATATLASLTMRAPRRRVLDLGTGSGIQALHASTHADQVVATDISSRALAFASVNRCLNAPHARWDLRRGSMLEPVAGEAFDLVVSNPPFVITPPGAPRYEYRATDAGGDSVMAGLVAGVGAVLEVGGVAQMLGNWEVRHADGWAARIESWLDAAAAAGTPLDAWVMQRDLLDPAAYAETWLRDGGLVPERERAAFHEAYAAYLDDFDARGVDAVGFGVVLLRRTEGAPTLRRLEVHDGPLPAGAGDHVAAVLAAHDRLSAMTDDEVLAQRWVAAGDVTKETYGRATEHEPEHIALRQGGGFGRSMRVDTAVAGFVGACDGELTGAQIAGALAALLDVPAHRMATGLAARVRDLARDGFLVPTS